MTTEFLPQPYPLWCAEVSVAEALCQTSRVVGWWVVDNDNIIGAELLPVLARTRDGRLDAETMSITSSGYGTRGVDDQLFFGESFGESFDEAHDAGYAYLQHKLQQEAGGG